MLGFRKIFQKVWLTGTGAKKGQKNTTSINVVRLLEEACSKIPTRCVESWTFSCQLVHRKKWKIWKIWKIFDKENVTQKV